MDTAATLHSPRLRLALIGAPLWLAACAGAPGTPRVAAVRPASRPTDWRWLGRVGYLGDADALAALRRQGRALYLDEQLAAPAADPPALAAAIAALPLGPGNVESLRAVREENRRIAALGDPVEQQRARADLNRAGQERTGAVQRRHLLRALYSPTQLREQMTWFWTNHFSVYSAKGQVRWMLADYEETTIRPRVFGRFDELVTATLTAPAMLEFLDNAQSAVGRVNENYARELMELHTLGVAGGASGSAYTQQDVQELARVLTGVGLQGGGGPPRLAPQRQPLYRQEGLFEFNPNRHDVGMKTLLGQRIDGSGFDEVHRAIALLTRQRACAVFVSQKLAAYFVADRPPPSLVERMADRFQQTSGDIAEVLRVLFLSPELDAALQAPERKFKDPVQFVVSAVKLAYAERPPTSMTPLLNWLQQLGEPLYGRISPDGYPASEAAWASSGQMVRRLEIARTIGAGPAALYAEAGALPARAAAPRMANRMFHEQIEPQLGAATRAALLQTTSQAEWNAVLLASPEWMQR